MSDFSYIHEPRRGMIELCEKLGNGRISRHDFRKVMKILGNKWIHDVERGEW